MFVLTSALSASASEVLVGGLVHFGEATQVGGQTFGKSRVIFIYILDRGDGFQLTSAVIYHADSVDREGIGWTPEGAYENTDPFVYTMARLGLNQADPLADDWELPEWMLPYLYDQEYWRYGSYAANRVRLSRASQVNFFQSRLLSR